MTTRQGRVNQPTDGEPKERFVDFLEVVTGMQFAPLNYPMGRVVLIEDSADYAFLVRRAFQKSCPGEEILHFSHGTEALDFFANVPAGEEGEAAWLVLTDLQMPEVNGFQVLSALKSNPRFCDLPIIVLTTSDSPSDRARSFALGAQDFITKPARIEDLRSTLKAVCGGFRGDEVVQSI